MPDAVDLDTCAREPIHIPGAVQSFAAMVVADRASRRIVQHSANLADWLADESPLGRSLGEAFPEPARAALERALDAGGLVDQPRLVFSGELKPGVTADVTVHEHQGRLLVELEASHGVIGLPTINDALRVLGDANDIEGFGERLAQWVRTVTGHDRVMVYRFADDGSGWVFAESKRDDLEPFFGLHYPASDIPAQARRLFVLNRTRLLADRAAPPVPMRGEVAEPTDMSHTFSRAVSPIHLEYLANMGVRATLSLALVRPGEDRLWGLVACHHYAPLMVGASGRAACETLTLGASFVLDGLLRRERMAADEEAAEHLSEVSRTLASHDDFFDGVAASQAELAQLFDGSTFGVCSPTAPDALLPAGIAPTTRDALLAALAPRMGEVFASDHLAEDLAPIEGVPHAGLLAVPCTYPKNTWLMWFRSAQHREVHWSGDPTKTVTVGPLGDRLTPRKSFELWVEEVEDRALPWHPADQRTAERLRVALADVVYRERERLAAIGADLETRTKDLESFSTMASHDLREPLRAISNYALFLREDNEGLDEASVRHLDRIEKLIARMYTLIDGMLVLSRLGRARLRPVELDLNQVVAQTLSDLAERIAATKATIEVDELPSIVGWDTGLVTVFTNLVSNALKYSEGAPHVSIGATTAGQVPSRPAAVDPDDRVIFVRDRGIGIGPESIGSVFRMFHRLHPNDRYGEGSGAGLPIVRRAVERMGGEVWLESAPGEGSTFYFSLPEFPTP